MHTKIIELLNLAVANKASDLHLVVGIKPRLRVSGELFDVTNVGEFTDTEMSEMILSLLSEEQQVTLKEKKELDLSISIPEARFRTNIYYQKGLLACALRVVPPEVPTFDQLKLPDLFHSFIHYKQGFVLITGPTGQGKSTTAACILEEINQKRSCHMVTIEDPIEYILKPKQAIISQRELGFDTNSFPLALRSCLRQDPNVVFVGEMRDLESISSSLTIAETGHLVFSSLHTNSASQTIDRIVDVFPDNSKALIRVQLANVVTAIVSQRLVPSVDGGRVPAFEILIATPAVRNVIREGKTFMLDNIIQTSAELGMITMEAYLANLVKQGVITEETALSYCMSPAELQNRLRKSRIA